MEPPGYNLTSFYRNSAIFCKKEEQQGYKIESQGYIEMTSAKNSTQYFCTGQPIIPFRPRTMIMSQLHILLQIHNLK